MDLQDLSHWMEERNLKGHWEHSDWSQTVKPCLWKGKDVFQALEWAGELITTGEAGRRVAVVAQACAAGRARIPVLRA